MIKYIILTAFLLINLHSRENPFFPSKGEQDMPTTTNRNLSAPSLKRAAISLPSSARNIQKVTITYQNLDGSVASKSIELDNSIDWHIPIFVSQSMGEIKDSSPLKNNKVKKQDYLHLFSSKNIKFFKKEKELKVVTKDKMIRSFSLTNPYKIVLDFKKDVNLKSESKKLNSSLFKKIDIGTHNGYYRVVVTLDGQYKFSKLKKPYGYSISLR